MFKAARDTLLQAYPNAPWRSQVQAIGVFALGVVVIALLAGIYLGVSVQAATLGRETQEIQLEILELQRSNADLQTRLAELTSASRMERLAEEMGFRQLTSYDLEYLPVPGYRPKAEVELAPPPGRAVADPGAVPPALNQTLFDWIQEKIMEPAAQDGVNGLFTEVLPAVPAEP